MDPDQLAIVIGEGWQCRKWSALSNAHRERARHVAKLILSAQLLAKHIKDDRDELHSRLPILGSP